jgi:hypothetical protein
LLTCGKYKLEMVVERGTEELVYTCKLKGGLWRSYK